MLEQQHNCEQFAQMKAAAERILFSSTPRYPTIQRPMLAKDDSEREEQERELHAALQRVQNPFPVKKSKKPVEEYEEEELIELENTMLANLLRALHGMELSAYPLPTKRTSNPNRNIYTFDLLYDRETGAYVLALSFHGKGVEYGRRKLAGITGKRPKARKSDAEIMPRFKPQVGENLCYVNAPGVQYQPPKRAQTLMFSLEYGKKHQDMRILQRFMRQRMQAQQPVSSLSTDHTPDDTAEHPDLQEIPVAGEAEAADTLPEASETTENEQAAIMDEATEEAGETDESAPQKPSRYKRTNPPIAAVRVVCRWNKQQQPEFFAHFSVPIQVAPCTLLPECVLGIHEHNYGYSYALLSLAGEVIEVGDLPVHEHVMPRAGDKRYNPNYAPEVAHAIVELAARHNAYIGLQDTGAKQEVSVSRAHNRRTFGRPSRKIAQIVADHALAAQCEVRHEDGRVQVNGLMKPRLTSDISPARDCAHCGRRMEKKKHGVRDRLYVACPTCTHQQPFREDTDLVQRCDNPACTSAWRARQGFVEQEFVCSQCDAPPMVARYNTAIVTAQRTLEQLVIHHERSSARTRENKPRKQGIKVSTARQLRKNKKKSTS